MSKGAGGTVRPTIRSNCRPYGAGAPAVGGGGAVAGADRTTPGVKL